MKISSDFGTCKKNRREEQGFDSNSIVSACGQSLVVLLCFGILITLIASELDSKIQKKMQKQMEMYGLPWKDSNEEPSDLNVRNIESISSKQAVDLFTGVERSTVQEKELSNVLSPGCLAYKPEGKGGLYPVAYADGAFHEVLFNFWNGTKPAWARNEEGITFKVFPELNVPTVPVQSEGLGTAFRVPGKTLYAYIPPVGFNFWLQYTSIFEPQFVNMLSMISSELRVKTKAEIVNSIIYNAICSGPTVRSSYFGGLSMGSTSETGRQLQLVGLKAIRALNPSVLMPRNCGEWQSRFGLGSDGKIDNSMPAQSEGTPRSYPANHKIPRRLLDGKKHTGRHRIAACFDTLVTPRAYSLGQFYSNAKRVSFKSVHLFRSSFFKEYGMTQPLGFCQKLETALTRTKTPIIKVGVFGREDSSHRILRNADEIAGWIQNGKISIQGIRLIPVRIRSMSAKLETLAKTLRDIDILIAPHGAHWANAIFLPEHAVGIEVNPGCWPKQNYNPWQEFYRGSASFSHVMDSLMLRNYEVYACSENLKKEIPWHWTKGARPLRFNCNILRHRQSRCDFAASLDSLKAVFGMIEDKLRDADMDVFKSDVTRRNKDCRNGCCTHGQVDCALRRGPLCPNLRMPRAEYRPTTDPKNLARLAADSLPRVPQD